MKALTFVVFVLTLLTVACNTQPQTTITSPNGVVELNFFLSDQGQAQYAVVYNGNIVIDSSSFGFEFKNQAALKEGIQIKNTAHNTVDNSWKPVWGEQETIRNHYKELLVELQEQKEPHRRFNIRFRLFDDGLGFRYEFPEQEALADSVHIMNEHTEFTLTNDHTAWWIPADYDSYEYNYKQSLVSEIDASEFKSENERVDRQIDNFKAVNTPVTLKTDNGIYLSLHEADLTDYAGMTLGIADGLTLKSELVPWADGTKVKTEAPFHSPWRTVQIATTAGDLAESSMILNLNAPNKLQDTDWITPLKYTGVWWELHIGKTSWNYSDQAEDSFGQQGGTAHGATTENVKKYIDFNDRVNIKGLLVEGWNTGWEYWGTDSLGFFDFTTPYPDFDLQKVATYARKNDIALIGHHETSGQAAHYETRLDTAFQLYQKHGIHHIKTGYAGGIIPKGEYHHGQWMVQHYRKVVETAAKYQIGINAHEPIKATGIRRTYPNMMTREGVRGMEYNAWSDGMPPEHTTILPFTRVLGGPVDYTPGIFDITFDQFRDKEQVHSTLANQLALYVILYSPMQMAADLPENYTTEGGEIHPMFQFIQDVPVNWSESITPMAAIGDYVVTARKQKDTANWYLGAVTDEQERTINISLDFLQKGKSYNATIYRDGKKAHWQSNPTDYDIENREVSSNTTLKLWLAPGGGTAISIENQK
ncbi:glycoside hydrolase family 97 protein [Fodinibius halophilus]|uniref:Glycoside hydrolase family 97 protein n=1 Tax=Fodinibius halophilus TaxID=1736908 RepID=A0A6M1ST98_9BACT|nr:glycoside hydrolase family 97 protein [Fodinibius halophilus]NGP86776.1 glycoside hydrolase family 97 protein [Fodinibius halophilus]